MAGALTLRFANRSYAILKQELANLGAGDAGRGALDMMELDRPALDWGDLAYSMGVEHDAPRRLRSLSATSPPVCAQRVPT